MTDRAARDREILELAEAGIGPSVIARKLGFTKNTVVSVIHRQAPHLTMRRPSLDEHKMVQRDLAEMMADVRAWAKVDDGRPLPTLWTRCDALNARMGAVLEATRVR